MEERSGEETIRGECGVRGGECGCETGRQRGELREVTREERGGMLKVRDFVWEPSERDWGLSSQMTNSTSS